MEREVVPECWTGPSRSARPMVLRGQSPPGGLISAPEWHLSPASSTRSKPQELNEPVIQRLPSVGAPGFLESEDVRQAFEEADQPPHSAEPSKEGVTVGDRRNSARRKSLVVQQSADRGPRQDQGRSGPKEQQPRDRDRGRGRRRRGARGRTAAPAKKAAPAARRRPWPRRPSPASRWACRDQAEERQGVERRERRARGESTRGPRGHRDRGRGGQPSADDRRPRATPTDDGEDEPKVAELAAGRRQGEDRGRSPHPRRRRRRPSGRAGGGRRRHRRPGQGLPQADRQGAAAQRRAGGRAGQADRGGPVRRGEAGRRRPALPTDEPRRPGVDRRGRHAGPRITCWRRTCGWWCRWPSGTPAAACCSWT